VVVCVCVLTKTIVMHTVLGIYDVRSSMGYYIVTCTWNLGD
jgi:hypothetical protein